MKKKQLMDSWRAIPALIELGEFRESSKLNNRVREFIEEPPYNGFILWTKNPWFMLEIFFWALFGILSSKIIECGYYVRANRYYEEGTFMHISHIVAVPFMVLVSMMLLSLLSFQVNMPSSQSPTTVDLANPLILAALSFILAFRPWGVRRFITTASDKVTGVKSNDS